jgi:CrcB protein
VTPVLWFGVVLCGGVGALARFVIDAVVSSRLAVDLPIGTFAVNVTGSALLGLLAGLALSGDAYLIAGTATVGSYTTFSTWMLESQRLSEDGEGKWGAANLLVSLGCGVAAAAAGRALGVHL